MTKNTKQSSRLSSYLASKTLSNPEASAIEKSLAGSVLSQTGTDNQTGEELQAIASKALRDEKSNKVTKSLAGSVVSQSTKDR